MNFAAQCSCECIPLRMPIISARRYTQSFTTQLQSRALRTYDRAQPVGRIAATPPQATNEAAAPAPSSPPTATASKEEIKVRAEVTRRIKDLGRQGKPKEAVAELAAMARLGVQPDTQSATALVDACMRCSKVEMAESVFQELFSELLTPDEVTFSVLVRGYGDQQPPRWTAISNALTTMEKDHGISPTALTFNALLEVCSKTNDAARGTEIIERMQAAGVQPDDFTLEAVKQRKSLRSLLKRTFMYGN